MKKSKDRFYRSLLRTLAALFLLATAILFLWLAFALGKIGVSILLIFIISSVATILSFLAIFLMSPIFWILILGTIIEKISKEDFIYYRKNLRPFAKKCVEKYLW